MRSPDFLAVGHLCCDMVDGRRILGGSASYASLTARKLGRKTGILTAVSDDFPFLNQLEGISIRNIGSSSTTTFRNLYHNGIREQYISGVARSIGCADVPGEWTDPEIVYLCPIANETLPDMAACFRNSLVGAGAQGWFREWDKSGKVLKKAWDKPLSVVEDVDVFVYSEVDTHDPYKLAEQLARHSSIVIVTQSDRGADVFTEGQRIHVPAFEIVEVDPTGAGDVFAAAFLIHYQESRHPVAAAKFACCAASFVCEREGTQGIPTLEQVRERMRLYEEVYSESLI